jgi:hypothetical protein
VLFNFSVKENTHCLPGDSQAVAPDHGHRRLSLRESFFVLSPGESPFARHAMKNVAPKFSPEGTPNSLIGEYCVSF